MASLDFKSLLDKADFGVQVLPDGSYEATIVSAAEKNTQGGKSQVSVKFVVDSGPSQGKSFFDNLIISPENPAALGVFFRKFERYGGNLEALKMGAALGQAAAGMVGRSFRITLGHREYNGNTYNNVSAAEGVVGVDAVPGATATAGAGLPW